jgi:hypothetical protein
MLPAEVIKTDHQLEEIASAADGQLAKHRWHWTLDESNPDRVTVSEYARHVGRSQHAVRIMTTGYAGWIRDRSLSLGDHVTRARMGTETGAAADAVAKARGIPLRSASRSEGQYSNETRRVRDIARQLAEERGTSVEEEAPKVAERIVKAEKAERVQQQEKAERVDLRVIEMEQHLLRMRREGVRALEIAKAIEFDDDGRDLISEAVASIKAVLGLIDAKLSGISGVNWDAEFAKMTGES